MSLSIKKVKFSEDENNDAESIGNFVISELSALKVLTEIDVSLESQSFLYSRAAHMRSLLFSLLTLACTGEKDAYGEVKEIFNNNMKAMYEHFEFLLNSVKKEKQAANDA